VQALAPKECVKLAKTITPDMLQVQLIYDVINSFILAI
jgi:hypothetical protein